MATNLEILLRCFLPVYLTVYLTFAFFWRSFLVWKRTGVNTYVLGEALMQIQVRLEEEHLRQTHGEEYQKYCHRRHRWV